MQDIATKVARVSAVAKAAGLTVDATRHLIHGVGGSPRRAKRAIRYGVHQQFIDTYTGALHDGDAHVQAVAKCSTLWLATFPSTGAEPSEDDDDASDAAETAIAKAATPAPRRTRRMGAMPSMMPSAADLKALLPTA